jgi:hypothetical protein
MRLPVLILLLFSMTGVGAAAQQTPTPVTLIAAKRGDAYSNPQTKIEARDKAADVVLMLRVGGLTLDQFRKINRDQVYVLAGEEQLPPNVVAVGVIDGKAEMLIVCVGPRNMRTMTLVLGTYPHLRFTAEESVAAELQ